jgi:predicted nucleic acid-binding protein
MAKLIVLDAGALIALHDDSDQHHSWALKMFIDTVDAELQMSVLTFAEVLVHPTKAGNQAQFQASIRSLKIQVEALTEEQSPGLAELRAKTGLKMPDAVVLSLALSSNAEIATTDKTLASKAREYGLGVYQP